MHLGLVNQTILAFKLHLHSVKIMNQYAKCICQTSGRDGRNRRKLLLRGEKRLGGVAAEHVEDVELRSRHLASGREVRRWSYETRPESQHLRGITDAHGSDRVRGKVRMMASCSGGASAAG